MLQIAKIVQVGLQGIVDSDTEGYKILGNGRSKNQGITLLGSIVDRMYIITLLSQGCVEQADKLQIVATLIVLHNIISAVVPIVAIRIRLLIVEILLHTYYVKFVCREHAFHCLAAVVVGPLLAILGNREYACCARACEVRVVAAQSLATCVPHIDLEVYCGVVVLQHIGQIGDTVLCERVTNEKNRQRTLAIILRLLNLVSNGLDSTRLQVY